MGVRLKEIMIVKDCSSEITLRAFKESVLVDLYVDEKIIACLDVDEAKWLADQLLEAIERMGGSNDA